MESQDKRLLSESSAEIQNPSAPQKDPARPASRKQKRQEAPAATVAKFGLLLALAVLFGYVEAIIPVPMPVPGMKLGLANIVIVTILYLSGWKQAMIISMFRVVIIGVLFGNLFSIAYGLAGTVLSLIGMTLLRKTGKFSVLSVSAAGGLLHNCGQILVAVIVVIGFPWRFYLPLLMLAGLAAGTITGTLNRLILPRVRYVWK